MHLSFAVASRLFKFSSRWSSRRSKFSFYSRTKVTVAARWYYGFARETQESREFTRTSNYAQPWTGFSFDSGPFRFAAPVSRAVLHYFESPIPKRSVRATIYARVDDKTRLAIIDCESQQFSWSTSQWLLSESLEKLNISWKLWSYGLIFTSFDTIDRFTKFLPLYLFIPFIILSNIFILFCDITFYNLN